MNSKIKILSIFVIGMMLMSSFVLALSEEELIQKIESSKEDYVGTELPGPVKMLFGDEKINVYIEDIEVGIVTEDGRLVSFEFSALNEPTVNAYSTKAVIGEILESEDKVSAGQQALDDKEITYEAVGVGKKVKFFFVGMAAKVAGWFM